MARSKPRRRRLWQSPKVWIIGGVAVIVAAAGGLIWLYRSIHMEEWRMEAAAIETVTSSTYMNQVRHAAAFHGDNPYTIVYGEDPDGLSMIAWVSEEGIHTKYAKDGMTEQEARDQVLAQHPDADILRVIPGVHNQVYVWEVFYRKKIAQGMQHYYDYYRFEDGHYIETYKMAVQKK
jgi:uncharacterized protein YpmB